MQGLGNFFPTLLQLVVNPDFSVAAKQCAGVAFKNGIRRSWRKPSDGTKCLVSDAEKGFVRENILEVRIM
jgi:hypothetical protein